MNRNNFLPHVALALVLILVAAFAGQLRRWQKHWRSSVRETVQASRSQADFEDENSSEDGEELNKPELLVKFRAGTSEDTIRRIAARLHDRVADEIESVSGLTVIDDEDNASEKILVAEYGALPEVEYVEPNYKIALDHAGGGFKHLHPDDPNFSEQWALDNQGQRGGKEGADISAMRAWAISKGSDEIVVAVLDTGVDYTHQDLAGNIWTRPAAVDEYQDENLGVIDDVHGFNAVDKDGDPMDENGHGTHCAGIIGAEGDNGYGITGVNWTVRIMPLKFMNAGGFGSTKDAIEAINYAIERKRAGVNVRVISASWGSTQKSRALEDVIRSAYKNGILFVAASGNASTNNDKVPHYPASFNVGNVISVAALNRNDELANFSNYGAKSVHVAAPGVEILSTWLDNGFEEHSGTSMATPVVAGVAALVLAKDHNLTVDELRKLLLESVDKVPSLAGKVSTGGRINAAKAVGAE